MSANDSERPSSGRSACSTIKTLGWRAFNVTLSVILAASLVPIAPTGAYATDATTQGNAAEQQPAQTPAQTTTPDSNAATGTTPAPVQTPSAEQSPAPDSTPDTASGEQSQQTENTPTEGQQGDDKSDAANGDSTKQGQDSGKQEQQSGSDKSGGNAQGDGGKKQDTTSTANTKDANANTNAGSKDEGNKDGKDEDKPAQTPEVRVLAAKAPTMSAQAAGETVNGVTYHVGSMEVSVTIDQGTDLAVEGGASVTLSYKKNENNETSNISLSVDGNKVTGSVTLEGVGTYTDLALSNVTGVTYGTGTEKQSFNPGGTTSVSPSGTHRVVDNEEPALESVYLKDQDGNAYTNSTNTDPLNVKDADSVVVEYADANTIEVTVKDDALNTNESSYVQAYDQNGKKLGDVVAFSKKSGEDNKYVATIITGTDSGVTGRIALEIVAKGLGSQSPVTTLIGGTSANGVIKANGSLIVDGKAPVVESVKIGENDVAQDETTFATGSINITVSDAKLDTTKSSVKLYKEGDSATAVASGTFEEVEGIPGTYAAMIDVSKKTGETYDIQDGKYQLVVTAADTFTDKGDDEAKARHAKVETTYKTIVVDHTAPKVTSVKVAGNDGGVETNGKYKGNTLVVTFEDENLDTTTTGSKVELVPAIESEEFSSSWNGNVLTLTGIPEGAYGINIQAKDKAGNSVNQEHENVTIDGYSPRLSFEYPENTPEYPPTGTTKYKILKILEPTEAEPLPSFPSVTCSITDFTITDTGADGAEGMIQVTKDGEPATTGESGDYEIAWQHPSIPSSSAPHVATLSFKKPGTYTIEISALDAVKNERSTHTETFVVAGGLTAKVKQHAPVVDAKNTLSDNAGDQSTEAYVNEPLSFDVDITGTYIDLENSTIAGIKLSAIADGNTVEGKTFSGLEVAGKDSGKVTRFKVTITYAEGKYAGDDLPVAKVKDWLLVALGENTQPIVSNVYQPFTVDITAPVVTFTTDPAQYANRDEASVAGKVLFLKKGPEGSELKYELLDTYGIASAEITDSDGYYDRAEEINATEGTCRINLDEEHEFTNAATLTVTDLAGNVSVWTLKDIATTQYNSEEKALKTVRVGNKVLNVDSPIKLVEDHTAPKLTLEGPSAKAGEAYYNYKPEYKLTVEELNFGYLKDFAGDEHLLKVYKRDDEKYPDYPVKVADESKYSLSAQYSKKISDAKADETKTQIDGKYDTHTVSTGPLEDGHYFMVAELQDLAGNNGNECKIEAFTVDTTPPTFEVKYKGATLAQDLKEFNGREYYAGPRTATITVNEHNFDPESFVRVTINNDEKAKDVEVPQQSWKHDGDVHTCTIEFTADGVYTLQVSGKDLAGNDALIKEDGKEKTVYSSPTFVIDNENPTITEASAELPAPTGQYNGKNYYSHGINVATHVKDRNFDPSKSNVYRYRNGTETGQNVTWTRSAARDADGYEVYAADVAYTEDGNYKTPHVRFATDYAGRKTESKPIDFVVDLGAPTISVEVDREPTSTGSGNAEGDPIQFFNQATSMTFSMDDEHNLRKFWIDDPDNAYVIPENANNVEGSASTTFTIQLRDGARESVDTEYQRNITLTVEDLAGNRRIWTIDRTGKVVKDRTESGSANTSINSDNVYPVALVQDTTAPVVTLAGVNEGTFYNSPQTVRGTVDEFNFDYLKNFDGSRVIMTVNKWEGNAGRAQSSWTVPASSFQGSRPTYIYDQVFDGDGHYTVSAEFLDYANNRSNRASIGEFTVDMTAPVIQVTWNNPAGNAPFYRETRVATITVTEHNFDPSLFSINTTGSISGWSSDGDTHTCTVTFGSDGTYTLTVSGRDQAGNEAQAFTEPEFTIDMTAPKVTFGGLVQRYGVERDGGGNENEYSGEIDNDGQMPSEQNPDETLQDHHAYNGRVMPTIEFVDQTGGGQTNYDAGASDYTLVGSRAGDRKSAFIVNRANTSGGEIYQFADFGLIQDNGEGQHNVYDPDADDVYTISARMADRAGNEATGTVTFSVNRYGSNFQVKAYSQDGKELEGTNTTTGINYDVLSEAPRIEVKEINVSGSASESDHSVLREYANVVKNIDRVAEGDTSNNGYVVSGYDGADSATKYGWSEYRYVIRPGNFGRNSNASGSGSSDGQGVYRVNVASVDRASNDTSSAEYLNSEAYQQEKTGQRVSNVMAISNALKNATAEFTMDEISPVVEINAPRFIEFGTSCTVTVHVTDAITTGDTVKIYVDDKEQTEFKQRGGDDGTGTYVFEVGASFLPFVPHRVHVVVTEDGANRQPVEAWSEPFLVTILVPEIGSIALVGGGVFAGVYFYRKRKAIAEPETPGSYE